MARSTSFPLSSHIHVFRYSSVTVKHQTKSRSHSKSLSPVYQPTSIDCHPDVGFESGAWLFDWSVAPIWFSSLWSTGSTTVTPSCPLLQLTNVNLILHRLASTRLISLPPQSKLIPNYQQGNTVSVWDNHDVMTDAFGYDSLASTSSSCRRQRVPTPFPTTFLLKEPLLNTFTISRPPTVSPAYSFSKQLTSSKFPWPDSDFSITVSSGVQDSRSHVTYRDDDVAVAGDKSDAMMDAFGLGSLFSSTSSSSHRQRVPTPFPTTFLSKEPQSYQFTIGQPISKSSPSPSHPTSQYPWPDSDFLVTSFNMVCSQIPEQDQSVGVIPVGSIKAQHWSPEDGFESGSWLFDESNAPKWLVNELKPSCKRPCNKNDSMQHSSSHRMFNPSHHFHSVSRRSPRGM